MSRMDLSAPSCPCPSRPSLTSSLTHTHTHTRRTRFPPQLSRFSVAIMRKRVKRPSLEWVLGR